MLHQEVKKFQKVLTCRQSTNRCSRVCFSTQMALIIVDNFSREKFVTSIKNMVIYFKLKHREFSIFFGDFKRESL